MSIDDIAKADAILKNVIANKTEEETAQMRVAALAIPALGHLFIVLRQRNRQAYTLRGILWSLKTGRPFPFNELLQLSWSVRQELCDVLRAFGYQGRVLEFSHAELNKAIDDYGLGQWFLEENTLPKEGK